MLTVGDDTCWCILVNILTFFSDLLTDNSQPLFPTPPSSGSTEVSESNHPEGSSTINPTNQLARNTEFLQHVITLQAGSQSVSHREGLQQLVFDSVINSLDLLQELIGSSKYSWNLQKNCIKSIVTLVDKASVDHITTLTKRAEILIHQIVDRMMTANSFQQVLYCSILHSLYFFSFSFLHTAWSCYN